MKKQNVILWGTGNYGASKYLKEMIERDYNITGYCDSNQLKQGTLLNGKEVLSPNEGCILCDKKEVDQIFIMVKDDSICEEIEKKIVGFNTGVQYSRYKDIREIFENRILDDKEKNMRYIWNIDYFKQSEIWVDNLMSEVKFWINDVAKSTGINHSNYEYRCKNKKFNNESMREFDDYEKYIESLDAPSIMDIGCGLAPRFGNLLSNGKNVRIIRVDPLSFFYNKINERYAKGELDKCQFGMFEYAAQYYSEGSMDSVIINNALDHCIDPYKSILELLTVLKNDGVIYMKHNRAEGINNGYCGLYQWNLDYNSQGDFLIWNDENAINITQQLKNIAEVHIECNSNADRNAQYVVTKIRKIKKFNLYEYISEQDEINGLSYINMKLFEFISRLDINEVFNKLLQDEEIEYEK